MAPWWSRSATEGGRGEDGAEEGSGCDPGFEDQDCSPPSQASSRSRASEGIEEQEGVTLMAKAEEAWDQLATRIPKELHRRLKLHCVTHDIVLMHFVTAALEEKLGRKVGSKKT